MKLLLAEDELRMAAALTELLRMEGYEVTHAADGKAALAAIEKGDFSLIILDVMMPGLSGFEVARRVREQGIAAPILMLTAKAETEDKVTGLDNGADDYLTKPFNSQELLARLRALTRRRKHTEEELLRFGDIILDTNTVTLTCTETGQSVRLGEKEFHILEYMLRNQSQILTREQLALKIWGYESEAEYNNVEVYMSFTRKKLHFIGAKTELKAVRGIGYELRYKDV